MSKLWQDRLIATGAVLLTAWVTWLLLTAPH